MKFVLFAVISVVFLAPPVQANVVGADTQNFNPITSGLDFVTVHSSETLRPCYLNCGFFLNYAVNSLPNFKGTGGSKTKFSDTLLSSDLNFGLGLKPNWDVGISVAQLHSQSIESDIVLGDFEQTGLTDIRLNTKYRFVGEEDYGMAVVASVNFNQIEDNPYVGQDPGPSFNLEFVVDKTFDQFAVAGNLGYRFRNPGEAVPGFGIEPIGNQIIASAGANYLLSEYDTKLIAELFTSFPASSQDNASNRELSSAELLLGVKFDVRNNIAAHFGGGTEMMQGTASPDWRMYAGVNVAFGPFEYCREGQSRLVKYDVTKPKAHSLIAGGSFEFKGRKGRRETFFAKDILFEFDSSNLTEDFQESLAQLVAYLREPPVFKKLIIIGHTDSVGKAAYNLHLSQQRAQGVRQHLIKKYDLLAGAIVAAGKGESEPVADNGNFQGRALNRRVEFMVER